MLSGDSGHGESICTPCSASERLFGTSCGSSKRSLFGRAERSRGSTRETATSEEDSDLGPMSPLAMTDKSASSRESSPGRAYSSPLATPIKSPRSPWDRLRPKISRSDRRDRSASFDALQRSTRAARSSPNRKIICDSPKSLASTPAERRSWTIEGTPEREIALLFGEDIVPETPRKEDSENCDQGDHRVRETPEKANGKMEQRLVTPLSSCCASSELIAPARAHRRKSLVELIMDDEETRSPVGTTANLLKRRANDVLECASGKKIQKMDDDNSSAPRARASLFPEAKRRSDDGPRAAAADDLTLSTKTFYRRALVERRVSAIGTENRAVIEKTKKRHSLPFYAGNNNNYYHHRAAKRSKVRSGEMNAGVRHGIKRPKPKRHVSRIETFKAEKHQRDRDDNREDTGKKRTIEDDSRAEEIVSVESTTARPPSPPPSPIADPNKRFFKTNGTLKCRRVATVTVSDGIKLRVSDGRIALNDRNPRISAKKKLHKRPRIEDMSFDATDLTVDEPNLDISMEKRNIVVDDILKVLENDWADDDYDTMDDLTVSSPTRTASASAPSNKNCPDITMSPASVLSNMTLSMNIQDSSIAAGGIAENPNSRIKLYPLFEKGFSSNITDENSITSKKKNDRGLKRCWQTSAKGGGAEDQYQIDAGQKKFGASTCSECGVVYQLGDPEDENAHLNYHNNVKTLRFNGWKQERVIVSDPFTNSRIIGVEPGDAKQCWKKVEQVLAMVDKDLGLAEMEISNYLDKKIYFYVRDKTILGVMVAERITVAHRMIPELADLNCCSSEDTPAKCGINVIWTAMSHRRQHIATKLVDTLRTTYYFGYIMSLEDIAFSMPTPSGKIFAEKYTKTRNFKVYS